MLEYNLFNWALIIFSLALILMKFIQKQEKHKNLPPTPPGLPILGHLHLLKEPLHETLHSLSIKYGPLVHLRFGNRRVVVVAYPSVIEECFTKTNDIIFANRPRFILAKHLNYNYTTMGAAPYGHLWRNLRRVAALEIFSTTRLNMTSDVRGNEVKLMVKQLMKNCGNGEGKENLKLRFNEISINIISMMIMGKRYYGENVADPKAAVHFRAMMTEFMQLIKISNLGDFLPIMRWMDFQGMERRMIILMKKMDKFLNDIVDERRRIISVINVGDNRRQGHRNMVDTLLALQNTEPEFYTDEIIKGLILIMLIAGTETSYVTMEWTMSLLLKHPESMKKVRSQIDAQVGYDRLIEEQDLRQLNYLENVINETLRLFPPVPMLLPREASDDCRVCGYDIPRGTILLINAWAMSKDQNLWENSKEFVPERFEGEGGEGGYKFIPFGTGRRSCPGTNLAYRMLGLVLGTLIQAFEWEINDGVEEMDMAALPGISLNKMKPLEAICKPRAAMARHLI